MDLVTAARSFYDALAQVRGWQALAVTWHLGVHHDATYR
jgi:hypothetical protein